VYTCGFGFRIHISGGRGSLSLVSMSGIDDRAAATRSTQA
jgi:hypothetical protein